MNIPSMIQSCFRHRKRTLRYDGSHCPVYSSDHLKPERVVIAEGDTRLLLPVTCGACAATWDEIYDLSGFTGLSASGPWEQSGRAPQSDRR